MVICCTCTENICFNCANVLQAVLACTGKEFHFEGWSYFYSFINNFSVVQPAYVCPYVSQRLVLTLYPPFGLRQRKGEAQGAYFWMGFRAALYYALMCIPRRPLGNRSLASCSMFFLSNIYSVPGTYLIYVIPLPQSRYVRGFIHTIIWR